MSFSIFRLRSCFSLLVLVGALAGASRTAAAIDAPVSPNPQPGVEALLAFFDRISGRYIVAGQQETGWDPKRVDEDIAFIKQVTGKSPAIRGLDFGDYVYSPSAPSRLHATERAIAWARQGGLVTFSCHMAMAIGSPAGAPQFYVPTANKGVGTSFDIRQAVTEGTPENQEFIAKMDVVATELRRLRDAGVTVIWRPFHECSGGWFWWGAHGPEPLKKAWRLMFDRFTKIHGLNNLIWCYNPTDPIAKNLPEWYPGDDVVDMLSIDIYPPAGTHETRAADYRIMRDFKAGRKVVVMSENGAIPDPEHLFSKTDQAAGWAYFCTWNGFENDPKQNSLSFLEAVYHHPRVITLEELPAVYAPDSAPPSPSPAPVAPKPPTHR